MVTMAGAARATTTTAREWRCWHCHRYLGRVVDGLLHEPNGARSGLPWVRRCTACGKRNVRLTS